VFLAMQRQPRSLTVLALQAAMLTVLDLSHLMVLIYIVLKALVYLPVMERTE
jgi:hypothetical protein